MIRGVVNARHEAVVRLRVRGLGGIESDVDLIVDSGFTASLMLPAALVGVPQGSGRISTKPPGTTSITNLCPASRRIPNSGSFPTSDTNTGRQVPPHDTSAAQMSN